MEFINFPILLLGLLLGGSILTSLISSKMGIPLILIFLCIGILVGGSGLDLINVLRFPKTAFSIGSVALALILFDSGYQTSYKSYKLSAFPAIILATVGVLLTTVFLTPIVLKVLGLSVLPALLLASIIGSTDSASVFFVLRSQGIAIREKIKSLLEVESGSNDPMAIFLTLSCIILIQTKGINLESGSFFLIFSFFKQFCIGIGLGVLLGFSLKIMVNKIKLEMALYPIFVLSIALLGFGLTNIFGGSGFLALYIAGFILGNSKIQAYTPILKFQQTLSWLSQITLFTSLGVFVNFKDLQQVLIPAFLIALSLMFLVRPLMVFIILRFFKYTFKEKLFISFVGLRGATSILLAIAPIVYLIPDAMILFNVVFVMVLISLSVQGLFIPVVAKWCQVKLPIVEIPPEKMQIDLPGLIDSSLLMYKLLETSPILNGERLPKWAHPILVIRSGISYTATNIHQFKTGDLIYVFSASDTHRLILDNLFGNARIDKTDSLLGDFPLFPETTFKELTKIYGVRINHSFQNLTIAQLITQEFEDVEVGDRLSLGKIELVIRSMNSGVPTSIGVDIDPSSYKPFKGHIHPLPKRG